MLYSIILVSPHLILSTLDIGKFEEISNFAGFDAVDKWEIEEGLNCQDQFTYSADINTRPILKNNREKVCSGSGNSP